MEIEDTAAQRDASPSRRMLLGLAASLGVAVIACPQPGFAKGGAVRSLPQYMAAIAEARRDRKIAVVKVSADWCAICRRLERTVFIDRRIVEQLGEFSLINVDVTAVDAASKALMQHLGIEGPPALLFIDPATGREFSGTRMIGAFAADDLVARLETFLS